MNEPEPISEWPGGPIQSESWLACGPRGGYWGAAEQTLATNGFRSDPALEPTNPKMAPTLKDCDGRADSLSAARDCTPSLTVNQRVPERRDCPKSHVVGCTRSFPIRNLPVTAPAVPRRRAHARFDLAYAQMCFVSSTKARWNGHSQSSRLPWATACICSLTCHSAGELSANIRMLIQNPPPDTVDRLLQLGTRRGSDLVQVRFSRPAHEQEVLFRHTAHDRIAIE